MTRARALPSLALPLVACLLLGGCGTDEDAAPVTRANTGEDGLPAPEGARGSVTGMPDQPGPGTIALPGDALPPDTSISGDGSIGPLPDPLLAEGDETLPERDTGPEPFPGGEPGASQASTSGAPTPAEAVALVRDYYATLDARAFERAHALWADGGRASGQSPGQFADGIAAEGTRSVAIGAPGQVDTSTGTGYIEVPVEVTTTYDDGSRRHFRGIYTLREDGAAWRIASADIREVGP